MQTTPTWTLALQLAIRPTLRLTLPLVVLASCSTPPKPATVDASHKRAVNTAEAVELQQCKNDLQNTRLQVLDSARQAEMATSRLNRYDSLNARAQLLASLQTPKPSAAPQAASQPGAPVPGNRVYTFQFEYGSARLEVPGEAARPLIEEAKVAPLVMLRARSDGAKDSVAENRLARERTTAVRSYLVSQGVEAGHIRATYQPGSEYGADSTSSKQRASGRAFKRGVEIEIYRSMPVEASLDAVVH